MDESGPSSNDWRPHKKALLSQKDIKTERYRE